MQEVTRRNAWELYNYLHLCVVFISQGFHQCIWGTNTKKKNMYVYTHTHIIAKAIIFLLYHRVFPSAYMRKTMSCAYLINRNRYSMHLSEPWWPCKLGVGLRALMVDDLTVSVVFEDELRFSRNWVAHCSYFGTDNQMAGILMWKGNLLLVHW